MRGNSASCIMSSIRYCAFIFPQACPDRNNKCSAQKVSKHLKMIRQINIISMINKMRNVMIDIFISFKNTRNGKKTANSKCAERLYKTFTEIMHYEVFMMNETLRQQGKSNYKKAIDKALDEARYLIVLGSESEDFESEWVRYEWDTYLCEILGGRKSDNSICTLRLNNLQVADLPIGLRHYQSYDITQLKLLPAFVDRYLSTTGTTSATPSTFVYPAVFTRNSNGYDVYFPDLDIKTDGAFVEEAYLYAVECLKAYFICVHKYDLPYNLPSDFENVQNKYPDSCAVMLILAQLNCNDNNSSDQQDNQIKSGSA